jgi:transposase-like protein
VSLPAVNKLSRRLNTAVVARLVAQYEAGATSRQLAVEFGIAKSSVLSILRPEGAALRFSRLSDSDKEEMARLYGAGMSQVDIARRFGRDPGLVSALG